MLFASLPDERIAGRALHPLPEVLLTALCAMVSDCESYTGMESFARSQLAWLRQFVPLLHGATVSIDTMGGHPDIAKLIQSQVRDKTAAHNLTPMRERSTKALKSSSDTGSVRSKRKRCALDPAFRLEVTRSSFHGFGAQALVERSRVPGCRASVPDAVGSAALCRRPAIKLGHRPDRAICRFDQKESR